MAKILEAIITPEILEWARKRINLSSNEAARKINKQLSPITLQDWENGKIRPSITTMRKIAKIYRLPLAAFFLSEIPKNFNIRKIPDRRMLDINLNMPLSYEMNSAILWAEQVREIEIELLDISDSNVPKFNKIITIKEDLDINAVNIRNMIGISIEEQHQFKKSYDAYYKWKGAIERLGIIVLTFNNVNVHEARGFSIYNNLLPIIAINIKDSINAKIFTLLHEFVHLLLQIDSICDNNDILFENNPEAICNQLAGRILVPTDSINALLQTRQYDIQDTNDVDILANIYRVSKEMMLTRLLILGYISQSDYLINRENLNKVKSSKKGFITPSQRIISNYGYPFLNLALTSYYNNKISLSTLCNYLSTNTQNLKKIENKIYQ